MRLSKCCDAEVKFGMVDDNVGHGMHEETECSNCGGLFPEGYDDEEDGQRQTAVKIAGRKVPGYPTLTFNVTFESADDLLQKIDKLIEEQTEFGKVDVYVDGESLTPKEMDKLESEYIIIE